MTGGPLFVQTEGLRQFSQTHTEIAAGLSQLVGGAATVAGVETSHGQIAFAVQNALGGLLAARQGTLETTAKSGDKIAELLRKAAAAYDNGDERSAGKLNAAIEEAGGGPRAAAGLRTPRAPKRPTPRNPEPRPQRSPSGRPCKTTATAGPPPPPRRSRSEPHVSTSTPSARRSHRFTPISARNRSSWLTATNAPS